MYKIYVFQSYVEKQFFAPENGGSGVGVGLVLPSAPTFSTSPL